MKLTAVRVTNYRTFVGNHDVRFDDGLNCIVGPNNTGKSNLLRAIALALQPTADTRDDTTGPEVTAASDLPRFEGARARMLGVQTAFQSLARPQDRRASPERLLLRRALDYERTANPGLKPRHAFASSGRIIHNVQFRLRADAMQRIEFLSVAGLTRATPETRNSKYPKAGSPEHEKFYREFRRQMRFVSVRSGEALESVLSGPFREVLESVIQEHLGQELVAARDARERYRTHLQTELLGPLSQQIALTTGHMFPEMSSADLLPGIPTMQETLSSMGVQLGDAMRSDLSGKGTGVRAGVLAAILRYLAEQSRRSLVFALEEPESFLHPAAQEDLRDALVELAAANDTTVLITTHSPFMVPEGRSHRDRVISISKSADGHSHIHAEPDRRHTESLFRNTGVARLLELAQQVQHDAAFVLVVEGQTDEQYFRLASRMAGRPELTDDIQFVHARGALALPAVVVLMAQATTKPVVALVDSDELGQRAAKTLKYFQEQPNRLVLKLGSAPGKPQAVDAESLWPADVQQRLHEAFQGQGKAKLKAGAADWLAASVTAADVTRLIKTIEWIRAEVGRRYSDANRPAAAR